jgi:hypothetical protein
VLTLLTMLTMNLHLALVFRDSGWFGLERGMQSGKCRADHGNEAWAATVCAVVTVVPTLAYHSIGHCQPDVKPPST